MWSVGPYGCEIVFRVQLRYYKYILRLNKSTNTAMILGELGKTHFSEIIKARVLNFWFRIVTCKNDIKLCKIMYDMLLSMFKKNFCFISNLLKYVKQSLGRLGLSYIWLTLGTQTPDMSNWFLKTANQRIRDQFISEWNCKMQESRHCVIYRMYKTEFSGESYLKLLVLSLF